jgi:hypothetical protein
MKFFKRTLAIVVLFAANSVFARDLVKKAAAKPAVAKPAAKRTVTTRRNQTVTQPTTQANKTYAQLVAFVKNSKTPDVWNPSEDILYDAYIGLVEKDALDANLDSMQFNALLQTARDYHAPFTNDQSKNIAMLQNLKTQRKNAIESFEDSKTVRGN